MRTPTLGKWHRRTEKQTPAAAKPQRRPAELPAPLRVPCRRMGRACEPSLCSPSKQSPSVSPARLGRLPGIVLSMAAKQGPNILMFISNRTRRIPFISVMCLHGACAERRASGATHPMHVWPRHLTPHVNVSMRPRVWDGRQECLTHLSAVSSYSSPKCTTPEMTTSKKPG
jgi:hypothetical protein